MIEAESATLVKGHKRKPKRILPKKNTIYKSLHFVYCIFPILSLRSIIK